MASLERAEGREGSSGAYYHTVTAELTCVVYRRKIM